MCSVVRLLRLEEEKRKKIEERREKNDEILKMYPDPLHELVMVNESPKKTAESTEIAEKYAKLNIQSPIPFSEKFLQNYREINDQHWCEQFAHIKDDVFYERKIKPYETPVKERGKRRLQNIAIEKEIADKEEEIDDRWMKYWRGETSEQPKETYFRDLPRPIPGLPEDRAEIGDEESDVEVEVGSRCDENQCLDHNHRKKKRDEEYRIIKWLQVVRVQGEAERFFEKYPDARWALNKKRKKRKSKEKIEPANSSRRKFVKSYSGKNYRNLVK